MGGGSSRLPYAPYLWPALGYQAASKVQAEGAWKEGPAPQLSPEILERFLVTRKKILRISVLTFQVREGERRELERGMGKGKSEER